MILIKIAAVVVSLLPAVFAARPSSVYDRPLAIVYARSGGFALKSYDNDTLVSYFSQVRNNLTSVIPFFLNVSPDNISRYTTIIKLINQSNTTIIPAVGGDIRQTPGMQIDDTTYQQIAMGYSKYFKYIRLEGLQLYYDAPGGPAAITNMIEQVIKMGFNHIMLNPWPISDHKLVDYSAYPQVDATIYQVRLNKTMTPSGGYDLAYGEDNWKPNAANVANTIDYANSHNQDISILINYENAPQELVLNSTQNKYLNSSACMGVTYNACQSSSPVLHWIPPWSENYDPVKFGTWNWITGQLNKTQS